MAKTRHSNYDAFTVEKGYTGLQSRHQHDLKNITAGII